MLAAMRRTSSRVSSFDRDQCRKTAWRLLMAHARASGRAVLAEGDSVHITVASVF
jgi:hypothetical protein